jgi:hypothetical protein
MTGDKRKFYVKFKVDQTLDTMQSIFLSEDLDAVNQWTGHTAKQEVVTNDEIQESKSVFQTVERDFEGSINVFQSSVPFIMSHLPIIWRFTHDKALRGFAKKHGKSLDSGAFELYELTF